MSALTGEPAPAPLEVARPRLLGAALRVLRPLDAAQVRLDADGVDLGAGRAALGWGDLVGVASDGGGALGGRVRIEHVGGAAAVSGLDGGAVEALLAGIGDWRRWWWSTALHAHSDVLARLAADARILDGGHGYVGLTAWRGLEGAAAEIARVFPGEPPAGLAGGAAMEGLEAARAIVSEGPELRERANGRAVDMSLRLKREAFDSVGRRGLTDGQRRAVVIDDDRNLVVAAAGSGKTSVIVAKAGWLVWSGRRRPDEILLLAFARNARDEMLERFIAGEAGVEMVPSVHTFHGLAMAVIAEAEGRKPSISSMAEDRGAMGRAFRSILDELVEDSDGAAMVAAWFTSCYLPYVPPEGFGAAGEQWDYLRAHDARSLRGELMKSLEEVEIANFLTLHSVAYEYERPYEHDTATSERRQYRPDFYLPDHGVYIEHFGIGADGEPPPFVDRDDYLRSRQWKIDLHERCGTVLVQTFSHERAAGRLGRALAGKLEALGVPLVPMPSGRLLDLIDESGRIDPFCRLVEGCLDHYKGSRLTMDDLRGRAGRADDPFRAQAFVALFGAILVRYQARLADEGAVDFHDLIARAAEHIERGAYMPRWRYVLVDEFQDIAPDRARLVQAILGAAPDTQLFAVGDDWQSIYRFTGSDITIMRRFGETFGAGATVPLGTTFRCAAETVEVATEFVLRNPAQLRKGVAAVHGLGRPSVRVGFPEAGHPPPLERALGEIHGDALIDGGASVLVLGRYHHVRPRGLGREGDLHRMFPGLSLEWRTVHGAKGLEADHVVVVGMVDGRYGFPTGIDDDPLLGLFLAEPEDYLHAEERRVLYVALTRARRSVYLLVEGEHPSPFVTELLDGPYRVGVFGQPPDAESLCPECGTGRLRLRRSSAGSAFLGCTNYPYCAATRAACSHCGEGAVLRDGDGARCRGCGAEHDACPDCGAGWLVERSGRAGRFLGCSDHPRCGHLQPLCPQCQSGIPAWDGARLVCPACRQEIPDCPRCGKWMVVRAGRHGPFLGCVSYPRCTATREL